MDKTMEKKEKKIFNPLRVETIIVDFVPQPSAFIPDPNHVNYGGMNEKSIIELSCPIKDGKLVKCLTDDEKEYLEGVTGEDLTFNMKPDGFWSNYSIILYKTGNQPIDLSNPYDYIKYKVLIANKDIICPDVESLRKVKKATYKFVLKSKDADIKEASSKLDNIVEAYKILDSIKDDGIKMSLLVEILIKRVIDAKRKDELISILTKCVDEQTKQFLAEAKKEDLDTRTLIWVGIHEGFIRRAGEYYYWIDGNKPMCEDSRDPVLKAAVEWLNLPKNQEYLFALQDAKRNFLNR